MKQMLLILLLTSVSTITHGAKETNTLKLKELLESEVSLQAETTQTPVLTPEKETCSQDKYNKTTPRGSFQSLSNALDERDYELALNHMDFRIMDIVEAAGTQLAVPARVIEGQSSTNTKHRIRN